MNHSCNGHSSIRQAVMCLLCLAFCGGVLAFPPAPHHALYGLVRNQWGDPIAIFPSDVFLETPSGTQLRASVSSVLEPGVNYRLEVPMDSGTAPDLYRPTALKPFFQFRLKVIIGSTIYLPIEMIGDFAEIGQPGESTRIDLTLGEDSDNDGLPDAWEQALIAIYGGTLGSIHPNGDSDGDGISNIDEYIAGTYAFDPSDGFSLAIAGVTDDNSLLEFLALRGRNYSIQASTNLKEWTTVSFRVVSGSSVGPVQESYQSTDVRLTRVEVPPQNGGETYRYFKAIVR